MIMNDEPQSVENEPRFKVRQIVYIYDPFYSKITRRFIKGYQNTNFHGVRYDLYSADEGYRLAVPENQIFPDFASCEVAAHATYLQKIKELLEQKEYAAN